MRFNNPQYKTEELTYEDVFLFQNYFDGTSRFSGIDVTPVHSFGTSLPIVVANMNAVSGKRMAETVARLGGLVVLPQDMELEVMIDIIGKVRSAHLRFDTPITVTKDNTVRDALGIIHKRAHNCVILVDEEERPLSIFNEKDLSHLDQFTLLGKIRKANLVVWQEDITDEAAFEVMEAHAIPSLPIIDQAGKLLWILTKKNAVRNSVYHPTLDATGRLNVAVALGVNHFIEKAEVLKHAGVEIFVLDTAHGYQKKMIEAIRLFRKKIGNNVVLIAGNVITAEATRGLLEAGANWVKVGIGPGAMCTTRMKTWVGRPQFTAVHECSVEAKKHSWFVWADGGVREPRDMVLALAAGANHVMLGTIFAGTYESTWDIKYDMNGGMYKENYGMASYRAVHDRTSQLSSFERAKRGLFQEGISSSQIYLRSGRESSTDIIDEFINGLRSAMTYVGSHNLDELYEKAVIWVQTPAGFHEGTPHGKIVQ